MSFTIRYNRTSVHIQGCAAATQTTGDGEDNGSGVVAYYAESACGSLTRNGYRMAVGQSYETAAEARDAAQAKAKSLGLKFCKNCETAVQWAVANAPFDPESNEFKAEKKRVNDELIARSEAAKAKRAAQGTKPEPTTTHADAVAQMRANRDAEEEARAAARRARNRTNYAPAPEVAETTVRTERKTRTFTFEYNASEGVLIAAALREKALAERKSAKAWRTNAEIEGTTLVEFYTEQVRLADNRAKLLEDAADRVHKPVREVISAAVEKALPDEPEPASHRQVKDAIGLRW
jgi:hypothetical protein